MLKITAKTWFKYIEKRAPYFKCPVCGQNNWQLQLNWNAQLDSIEVDGFEKEVITALEELILENGGQLPDEKEQGEKEVSLKQMLIIRCGHCGWIGLFDRDFVENQLDRP